ncbi:uncharacterized protein LOC116131677 [Pistacia vera]|uniref:uncharacterized protein LOC116131677 n=1 Tax=Pistacia vera TaxID=55513 RepID=UPI0012639248|nr:uncharacterized protein LOC116131677 [Pistacia vera]
METLAVKKCFSHGLSGVVAVTVPAPSFCFFGTNMCKVSGSLRKGSVGLTVRGEILTKVRTFVVGSNQVSSLQTQMGVWEEPDNGSDSDEEEEEEMEETDLDFESDWEEERNGVDAAMRGDESATNQYEEELVKGFCFSSPFLCFVFFDVCCVLVFVFVVLKMELGFVLCL